MIKDRNLSPCCGFKVAFYKLDPERPETYLTDMSPDWVNWYRCKKCNKKYREYELLNDKEYIGVVRTKLIDKILDEKEERF
jgi:hypothetical protein